MIDAIKLLTAPLLTKIVVSGQLCDLSETFPVLTSSYFSSQASFRLCSQPLPKPEREANQPWRMVSKSATGKDKKIKQTVRQENLPWRMVAGSFQL